MAQPRGRSKQRPYNVLAKHSHTRYDVPLGLAHGRVIDGKVVVDDVGLDEGAEVLVLIREPEGDVLTPEQEDELLAAIADIERGAYVDGEMFLKNL